MCVFITAVPITKLFEGMCVLYHRGRVSIRQAVIKSCAVISRAHGKAAPFRAARRPGLMLRPSVRLGIRALKDARAEEQEQTPSKNTAQKRKDGQQRFEPFVSQALVSMGAPTRPSARVHQAEDDDSGVRQPHLSGTGRRKDKVPNRGKTRGDGAGCVARRGCLLYICCLAAAARCCLRAERAPLIAPS